MPFLVRVSNRLGKVVGGIRIGLRVVDWLLGSKLGGGMLDGRLLDGGLCGLDLGLDGWFVDDGWRRVAGGRIG